MEGHASTMKEAEKKMKGRLMGKFFNKAEKSEMRASSQDDVNDFLHGPSDKLQMMPTATNHSNSNTQPLAPRIDTTNARRWPTAATINSHSRSREQSTTARKSRKGLVVRFTEQQPEIIGEGGDEATAPTSEIGLRKRKHTHPLLQPSSQDHSSADTKDQTWSNTGHTQTSQLEDSFVPDYEAQRDGQLAPPSQSLSSNPNRRSFAERVKDDMKSGEGLALLQATTSTTNVEEQLSRADSSASNATDVGAKMNELQLNTLTNANMVYSSGSSTQPDSARPFTPNGPQISNQLMESPLAISRTSTMNSQRSPQLVKLQQSADTQNSAHIARAPTFTMHEAALALGDEALQDFSSRIAHFFTLFRLSTEATKPLPNCSMEELVRAALWWFLKGRMNIEATIRDRPSTPQGQQRHQFARQQAYADLAKALWLAESIASQYPDIQHQQGSMDSVDARLADIRDCRQGIITNLRKLAMSMKRNSFLPPNSDNASLTQGLDMNIWTGYDGDRSLLASQRLPFSAYLSEAFPLGDTSRAFSFGRMFVEATLLEESASQHYRCPVLVSMIRSQKEQTMSLAIASQDGALNLLVQNDKNLGPVWDDLRWQTNHKRVEVKLPRGFILRLNFSEPDYRNLWTIYDYEKRTQSNLVQRPGEELVFETVLRSFQYFDPNPHSTFPKEPQIHCQLRVFEQSVVEKAATGPRTMHRGFRIGLNTSPKTKTLRGIDQTLSSGLPIQFGLLRGEGGLPALLLKFDDGKSKYTIVCAFEDVNERRRLHELLTGVALGDAEDVVAEAPLQAFAMSDSGSDFLKDLGWQNFRFINQENYGSLQSCKTVLSDHLRAVIDFNGGTITDRLNFAPGELKLRLDVTKENELRILRQPQQDMTISISESQVPKQLPHELAELLATIANSHTTRIYRFPSTKELHLFQSALTGFTVLFDGFASSFNISRRRMVVPIYKKWDASLTRLQIVQKEKVFQLVAFFEKFAHGECMNFVLKSTDVFESSGKSGKFSVRIVDAKFALPKHEEGGEENGFVCLDIPEYPGEHDDVTIVFEKEEVREQFTKALPAPTKIASRMGSIRK